MINLKNFVHVDTIQDDIIPIVEQTITLSSIYRNKSVNKSLFRKSLENIDSMGWIKSCEFNLVIKSGLEFEHKDLVDTIEVDSLNDLIDIIKSESITISSKEDGRLKSDLRKLIAVDLETTTLDTTFRYVGGKVVSNCKIVGVCIASSDKKGYYIPVLHNELDGVSNWKFDEVTNFLNIIQSDDFYCVWHNAMYDLSVLRVNSVVINPLFSDTLIINRLMNNFEFFPIFVGGYLKRLSAHVLKREMIEIQTLFDLNKKDKNFTFYTLPAVNANIYGSSDAMNTYGLFKSFVLDDTFDRSPMKNQPLIVNIEHKNIYHSIGMLSHGLPIDYNRSVLVLKSMIRRKILLERKFKDVSGVDIKMTAEKVGQIIGSILFEGWTGSEKSFDKFVFDKFCMNVKRVVLKSGMEKVTYSNNEKVTTILFKELENGSISFISKENSDKILKMLRIIRFYRSLEHEIPILASMIRNSKNDDRNYSYINVNLRVHGTDTGRFASSEGKGVNRVSLERMKTKIKGTLKVGDGVVTSLNSQGISTRKYMSKKLKKVISFPENIKLSIDSLSSEVDIRYRDYMMSI